MAKTISIKKAKNILESQNLFKCDLKHSEHVELLPYTNSKNNAENAVLSAIIDYLARCSLVASSWRNNVGAVKRENRFVRFARFLSGEDCTDYQEIRGASRCCHVIIY